MKNKDFDGYGQERESDPNLAQPFNLGGFDLSWADVDDSDHLR